MIGDGLRWRTDERRATEMDVAVQVLNRMLELGRPTYVPSPEPRQGWGNCARIPDPCTTAFTSHTDELVHNG